MKPLAFTDVASLIRRVGNTSISEEPSRERPGEWSLYEGTIQSGGISVNFHVLYLLSDATTESFRTAIAALKELPTGSHRQVVYPRTVWDRYPTQIEALKRVTTNVLSLKDYFSSFIRQQIDTYLTKIISIPHPYYVNPQITVPAGVARRIPNPVLSLLKDDALGSRGRGGALGILLAEPGQGKTFMSRYLAARLAQMQLIPVYVHSEQWSLMQRDDLSSLWKTIVYSFRYFDCPIGWIEGAEHEFLKVALKAGLFRIIFDGFDEYVLWNQGKVDALDTIQTLQQLADETGARILITSRTSFWETEIKEKRTSSSAIPSLEYIIQPFDLNHARNYFTGRFPDSTKMVKAASRLFEKLKAQTSGATASFIGRGFFLYLIADLVKRDPDAQDPKLQGQSVIQWIMDALCERERTRQQLPLSAKEQLDILREFAVFCVSEEPPTPETLRIVIGGVTNAQPRQIDELVGVSTKWPGKLRDHPLIRRIDPSGEWHFVQEQVMFVLLAERLIELSRYEKDSTAMQNLVTRAHFTPNLQTEVATALVDQFYEVLSATEVEKGVKPIIAALLRGSQFQLASGAAANPTSLACTIAVLANKREFPKGSIRSDKTFSFLSLFPGAQLKNLCFTGTLARFDFSETEFANCHFDEVTWASCKFDDKTEFVGCRFTGGNVLSCDGYGLSKWSDSCLFDRDAFSVIDSERVRAGRIAYTGDDLRADIGHLIKRFIPKEGAGIKSVEERNLTKGAISNSIHKDTIVAGFKRYLIEAHHLSGPESVGYNVRNDAKDALLHFAGNGVFTGKLDKLFRELRKKLDLD